MKYDGYLKETLMNVYCKCLQETEERGDNTAPRQGPTDGAVRSRADQDH